jgi:ATP-dependent Clp endopeptidase proteolytic subunit ClpP
MEATKGYLNMKWKSNLPAASDHDDSDFKMISIGGRQMGDDSEGNKIYFYEEVTKDSILNLNKQIDSFSKSMKNLQFTYDLAEPPPIELHICSEGGDALSCMAAVDKITASRVPIHTYIEGYAASAATLISVAGKKRFITPSSSMLIHQVSSGLWGTYAEFKDEMKNLELLMNTIRSVYLTKTSFKREDLDKLLERDLFLTAEDSVKMGLVDAIKS